MLNRRMRGFGTILFDMVPKATSQKQNIKYCFGTILFDMVPKVWERFLTYQRRFGTILFDMVPKGYNTKRI